jgi:hypothetical protein
VYNSHAAHSQVDPELMALILNLSDNQKSELMQRYGDSRRLASPGSRRSSEPAVPSPGSSSGGSSSLGRGSPIGRGGLAAMGSGRGSMMRQQVASKRIDFSVQGRNALTSVNSDSDEEPPLTDRLVARHTLYLACHLAGKLLVVEVCAAGLSCLCCCCVLLLEQHLRTPLCIIIDNSSMVAP